MMIRRRDTQYVFDPARIPQLSANPQKKAPKSGRLAIRTKIARKIAAHVQPNYYDGRGALVGFVEFDDWLSVATKALDVECFQRNA